MMMFLTLMFAGLLFVALFAAIVAAEPGENARPEMRIAVEPPRFFATPMVPGGGRADVPVELVLNQIENHVRLEQVAAERFVNVPTPEALHSPTASPFVN